MSRYIDAEALKHILNQSKYYGTKAGNAFADMITECTSADVQEEKHAHWLRPENACRSSYRYNCSACKQTAYCVTGNCGRKVKVDHPPCPYKYCPNCGARMDAEENHSILSDERECYFCRRTEPLHRHHIFPGRNRQRSEDHGCWVWLCPEHHVFGVDAVHNNTATDQALRRECQRKFEETHTREGFVELFGRSYL